MTIAEMSHSHPQLLQQKKSLTRGVDTSEPAPRVIQLLGYDASMLAEAARYHADRGADIIDLNLGCPAKKVCRISAGSALMQHPKIVAEIFRALRKAVSLPLTVKIRTGTNEHHKNALEIARMAEEAGFSMLTIHGRTREQKFTGQAEYDTIANITHHLSIPVIANGDIDCGSKAASVLKYTNAAGVMIGRAAMGNPWVFSEIRAHFENKPWHPPNTIEVLLILRAHIAGLHALYGEPSGVRIARKHVTWYVNRWSLPTALRQGFNQLESALDQTQYIEFWINEYTA